jgi:hypothetical protein
LLISLPPSDERPKVNLTIAMVYVHTPTTTGHRATSTLALIHLLAVAGSTKTLQPLVITLHPSDCGASAAAAADCHTVIATAIQRCRTFGSGCSVILTPGHYRVRCPPYKGPFPYIYTPGAVDLSNTSGLTFGGAAGAPANEQPQLDVDYIHQGCPAVGATDATDVTVQSIVFDTTRSATRSPDVSTRTATAPLSQHECTSPPSTPLGLAASFVQLLTFPLLSFAQ